MRIRFDSQAGPEVSNPDRTLQEIYDQLASLQRVWGEHLDHDPASFPQLEPKVHLAFQQCADRLVASMLAHAAQHAALAEEAKKK
jgi:hypothetical protein